MRTTLRLLLWMVAIGCLPAVALAQDQNQSPHGTLKQECATCHRSDGWTPVRISKAFNHGKLGFPLAGAHGSAACRACHQSLDFKGATSTCASCHTDVHRGELGADCSRCHTPRSFLDRTAMTRAHQLTRFPLEGAHLAADCTTCHAPAAQGNQQFGSRQTTCVSCHQTDYATAKNPDHVAGGFPRECGTCHAVTAWNRARFDHSAARFALTGAHRAIPCAQCHINNQFTGIRADCVGCHQQDYNGAADPDHRTAQFPTTCSPCHSTTAWQPASFDHNASSFPLTGSHKAVPCADCHGDGVYSGKPTACQACHLADFNRTTAPNHPQLGWPQTCITCHAGSTNTVAWDSGVNLPTQYHSMFDVNHQRARGDCTQCHLTTNYSQSTCSTHHHPPSCTYLNEPACHQ